MIYNLNLWSLIWIYCCHFCYCLFIVTYHSTSYSSMVFDKFSIHRNNQWHYIYFFILIKQSIHVQWKVQRAHNKMRPSAKWHLVFRQFNGELTVINLWKQKKTLSCYETWFHNVRPGFKKNYFHIDRAACSLFLQRKSEFLLLVPFGLPGCRSEQRGKIKNTLLQE
jgi:hypothetical protein